MAAQLGVLWTLPKDRNAIKNLARRSVILRVPFQKTRDGSLNLDDSNVLLEGWTYRDILTVCRDEGIRVIPCILLHDSGDPTGTGYHDAGGRGRPPYMGPSTTATYTRAVWSLCSSIGVTVEAMQLGNEVDYHPEYDDDWNFFLSQYDEVWGAFVSSFPGSIPAVIGSTRGEDTSYGRKSLAKYMLSRHSGLNIDTHGNNRTTSQVINHIQWIKSNNGNPVVLEDFTNDAEARAIAFSNAGARIVSFFASRDVPGCYWGVRATGKKYRGKGAPWTCKGFQQDEYDELTKAAIFLGTLLPGEDLPMDGQGSGGGGGNGGNNPPQGDVTTQQAIAMRSLLDTYFDFPRPKVWQKEFKRLWPIILGD